MFCFAIQLAAAGGGFDWLPALLCLGAGVVLLEAAADALLPEEETMGAVVGCAVEMETSL